MNRRATSFVLAYHGCERSVANAAVAGDIDIVQSEWAYDWLGPGAYFWESDPTRAFEWARQKAIRGEYEQPAVIGAVIDLTHCLDLTNRENLELVKEAYLALKAEQEATSGFSLPENRSMRGHPGQDRVLRFLDCAVIWHLHTAIKRAAENEQVVQPFETVRGMFTEGDKLNAGYKFRKKTYVQIAVATSSCIKGIFFLRNSG